MANRKNLANGILALGVSDTDTTWVLQNGYGAGMPDVPFYLTATPFGQLSTMGNSEIVNVTARTTDTLTVQRGAKGTTAKAFDVGAVVSNGIYTDEKWTSDNIDFTTFNFDTTERVIGKRGSKTVYQKVLSGTINVTASALQIPHGITGLDEMLLCHSIIALGAAPQFQVLPHLEASNRMSVQFDNTNITFDSSFAWGNSKPYRINLQYTKN